MMKCVAFECVSVEVRVRDYVFPERLAAWHSESARLSLALAASSAARSASRDRSREECVRPIRRVTALGRNFRCRGVFASLR